MQSPAVPQGFLNLYQYVKDRRISKAEKRNPRSKVEHKKGSISGPSVIAVIGGY